MNEELWNWEKIFNCIHNGYAKLCDDTLFQMITEAFPEFEWVWLANPVDQNRFKDNPVIRIVGEKPLVGFLNYTPSVQGKLMFSMKPTTHADSIFEDGAGLSVEFTLRINDYKYRCEGKDCHHQAEIECVTDIDYLFKFIQKSIDETKFYCEISAINSLAGEICTTLWRIFGGEPNAPYY